MKQDFSSLKMERSPCGCGLLLLDFDFTLLKLLFFFSMLILNSGSGGGTWNLALVIFLGSAIWVALLCKFLFGAISRFAKDSAKFVEVDFFTLRMGVGLSSSLFQMVLAFDRSRACSDGVSVLKS